MLSDLSLVMSGVTGLRYHLAREGGTAISQIPIMLRKLSKQVRDCHARTGECARKAAAARDNGIRKTYLRLQEKWSTLALSYEFEERLSDFSRESRRKRVKFYGDEPTPSETDTQKLRPH